MKQFKKLLALVIIVFTILTLISCGVNNSDATTLMLQAETTMASARSTAGFGSVNAKMVAANDMAAEEVMHSGASFAEMGGSANSDRKIVKTVDLNTETKTFDESIEWLKSYIKSFDGIIDNTYVDSGNLSNKNYRRNANFNVRIPATKLDSFLSKIGDNLNITFRQENISDITEEYSDTESRLNSLKIEEESLNSMLKKAKTVEEMIKVEDKLSSVRTDIENITRRLKRYDKQVTYSTVSINISEVKDLTDTKVNEDDFSRDTLVKQLNKNFVEVKKFVKKVAAYLFTNIPWIILGLIVILIQIVLYLIFKAIFGKKSNEIEKTASEIFDDGKNKDSSKKSDKENENDVEIEFFQEENEKS